MHWYSGIDECSELAESFKNAPRFISYDCALAYVRARIPNESETIISNVAWSLFGQTCLT